MACESCLNDTCVCASGIPLDTLLDVASSPQSISVDGQTVTERSATDLILLDNHVRAKKAACVSNGNGWGRIGVAKAVPPSAAGD